MHRWIILIGLGLVSSVTWARSIPVAWECSESSLGSASVKVSFDSSGKLQFEPDIFDGQLKSSQNGNYSNCLEKFQRQVDLSVSKFKESDCPASKDPLCFASNDYINEKVIEKIQSSKFLANNSSSKLAGFTPATAAKLSGGAKETPQSYLEEQIAQNKISPKDLSAGFDYQGKTYRVSDFDKVIGDNIENIMSSMGRDEAKQFAQNYLTAKSQYLKSISSSSNDQVLSNLHKMFGYIYGEKGEEELAKILECAPESDQFTPIAEIVRKVHEGQKVSKCQPLEPGDFKVFSQENRDYYGTGNYLLERKPDGNYRAVLNIDFRPGTGSNLSPADMLAKAKNCLKQISPYIKGPGGQTLEMVPMSSAEILNLPENQRPLPRTINIEKPSDWTDAAHYGENIDCPTITHEMLHLLGLCDEYKEEGRAERANMWQCRVVTKDTSIMRETVQTFNKVVGRSAVCGCTSATCKAIIGSSNENLKKLLVSQRIYDVTDMKFRTTYCREKNLVGSPDMSNLDKAVTLTSNSGLSFSFENRVVLTKATPPYYKVDRTVISCQCPSGDNECLNKKEEMIRRVANIGVQDQCPGHMTFLRWGRDKFKTDLSLPEVTLVSKPTVSSLLRPNQFNKILAGNCPGIADSYNECASYAYKSLSDGPCNAPARCSDDKYYLGSER